MSEVAWDSIDRPVGGGGKYLRVVFTKVSGPHFCLFGALLPGPPPRGLD